MPRIDPDKQVKISPERKTFIDAHMQYVFKGQISELGYRVLDLIDVLVQGLHHFDASVAKKVDWSDPDFIEVKWRFHGMSTFDFSHLTRLVLLSHDKMVRVELNPQASGMFNFLFHGRHSREGGMSERFPTIETVLAKWRETYPSVAEQELRMTHKFSLNAMCRVTLSERGVAVMREYYEWLGHPDLLKKGHPELRPGYELQAQLWDLFQMFGRSIGIGIPSPFEPIDIHIDQE